LDPNHKGVITKADFKGLWVAHYNTTQAGGASSTQLAAIESQWAKMDVKGVGKVTRLEFVDVQTQSLRAMSTPELNLCVEEDQAASTAYLTDLPGVNKFQLLKRAVRQLQRGKLRGMEVFLWLDYCCLDQQVRGIEIDDHSCVLISRYTMYAVRSRLH
jgi:hypothetical protein